MIPIQALVVLAQAFSDSGCIASTIAIDYLLGSLVKACFNELGAAAGLPWSCAADIAELGFAEAPLL